LKILISIYSLSHGGAERVTTTLADYWAERGWQVAIVTIAGLDRDFYQLDSRIERIALELDHNSANPIGGLVNNLRRIVYLRRVIKRQQPDVAVSMMATSNVLLALAGMGLNVPTIGSERIHPPKWPLGRIWELLRRWAYPKLTALVAQTEQSAIWLRQQAPAPKIAIIPNPVNFPLKSHEPYLQPVTVREDVNGKRMLLAVGRLTEQKGFDLLISAFSKLVTEYPDWSLIILGEGEERLALEQQIKELNIADKVHLLGAVGNLSNWYEAADLYVLSSRFEGFPNTLLEAMAHGLPVVAMDCETGPSDIISHGVDGLLVSQGDMDGLAVALGKLMADDDLRSRFAVRGVEVRKRFSLERIAVMWEQLFDEVRNAPS